MRTRIPRSRGVRALLSGTLLSLALAAPAGAQDSCREWTDEHCELKAKVMGLALRGASPDEIDAALFELLQREAYLTSCESSVETTRAAQVGWRLVSRAPDEYASAVFDSVLARAGLDPELRGLFAEPVRAASPPSAPRFRPLGRFGKAHAPR